ncbi:MAG TPA: cation diffusion facilitator family transporter [Sphingomonas sp.]
MAGGGKRVVYTALAGNLAIAATKLVAALLTGSSSMLTEAIHSAVDTGNQGLLLYGMKRSRRAPDIVHPLGYGRELYFWSFIVALLIFTGGAGVSLYEGVAHIRHPAPIDRPLLNFIVLGAAFLFEGSSWYVAHREFRRAQGDMGWWEALRRSKDPTTFVVLFEDSAALVGIVIAAVFIGLSIAMDDPRLDGVGSILIGILLGVVAFLLARESKGLLIGERANPALSADIAAIARREAGVCAVNNVLTVHLAPDQVLVTISLDFDDSLDTRRIEAAVTAIERQARAAHPEIVNVFIRPQAREALSS